MLLPFLGVTLVAACARRPGADAADGTGARPMVMDNVEIRVLPVSANGRRYQLYVGLPESYASHPERRYPVLYLCDGYWDFNLVRGFYGNLLYDKVIPELIVVGLGYPGQKPDFGKLRLWDLTPVHDTHPGGDPKGSGHAAEFLAAIEHEVIPFVESTYRADGSYRVLGGSSLGGLFTLYTMFTRPALFRAYIAPSPAAEFGDDWLFGYEEAFARSGARLDARLFMTGAEKEWPFLLDSVKRFDARLRERAYPGLTYQFRIVDGERHAGTKAESYNRGVRFAFAPLAPPPDAGAP